MIHSVRRRVHVNAEREKCIKNDARASETQRLIENIKKIVVFCMVRSTLLQLSILAGPSGKNLRFNIVRDLLPLT